MEEFGQMQAFSATHLSQAACRSILDVVTARASYAQTTAGWKSSLYGALWRVLFVSFWAKGSG